MTNKQIVHIGILNSYNVITGRATPEQILNAGIGFFAHDPTEMCADTLNFIIDYFTEHEMFENCAELKKIYDENYNEDGTPKESGCECDYPKINEYNRAMRCGTCNKRIIR